MKKPKAIALSVVAVLVAITATILWRNHREPTYQGQPLRYWVVRLSDGYIDVSKEQATNAVRQIGSAAVPHLVKWMQAKESRFDRAISTAYYKLPTFVSERLPELYESEVLNHLGIDGLRVLGPEARAAVPALAETLTDAEASMKLSVALILISFGKEGVPPLIEGLRSKNAEVRRVVAGASLIVTRSKPLNEALHQQLTAALRDQDQMVRLYSAQALLRIDSQAQAPVQVIMDLVREGEGGVRIEAMLALDGIAPRATELVPTLITILADDDMRLRLEKSCAIVVLAQMGSAAKEAVPVLTRWLTNHQAGCVPYAAEALGWIGPEAQGAVPTLQAVAGGTNQYSSVVAAKALWRIERDTNTVLAMLPQWIQKRHKQFIERPEPNTEDIDILGEIGPAAWEAVPSLLPLLNAQSPAVRAATERTLQSIDPSGSWRSASPSPTPDKVNSLR